MYLCFPERSSDPEGLPPRQIPVYGNGKPRPPFQIRLNQLVAGEPLLVTLELNKPATGAAVQIQTEDYHMIGWAPRNRLGDLVAAIAKAPGDYSAFVVRVNRSTRRPSNAF